MSMIKPFLLPIVPYLPLPPSSIIFLSTFFFESLILYLSVLKLKPPRSAPITEKKTFTRQISWILTLQSSFLMSVCSIPFVYKWFTSFWDVRAFSPPDDYPLIVRIQTSQFMAYLLADILWSRVWYKDRFTMVTGWGHHVVYSCLIPVWERNGWGPFFCMAGIMELPTLILSISQFIPKPLPCPPHPPVSSLSPTLISDYLFTLSFFLTRIFFHVCLIIGLLTPYGRKNIYTVGRSIEDMTFWGWNEWRVGFFFTLALPMHVWWFGNAVKGLRKRAKSRRREKEAWRLLIREREEKEKLLAQQEKDRMQQEEEEEGIEVEVQSVQLVELDKAAEAAMFEELEEESYVPPPPPYQSYPSSSRFNQTLSSTSAVTANVDSTTTTSRRRRPSKSRARRSSSPSPSPSPLILSMTGRFPTPPTHTHSRAQTALPSLSHSDSESDSDPTPPTPPRLRFADLATQVRDSKLGKEMEDKLREVVARLREMAREEGDDEVMRMLGVRGKLRRLRRGGMRGLGRWVGPTRGEGERRCGVETSD